MLLRIIFFFLYMVKDILIWMKRLVFGGKSKNDTDERAPKIAKTSDEIIVGNFKTDDVAKSKDVVEEKSVIPSDIRISEHEKKPVFGRTLADFGYAFNEKGELRNVNNGSKFIYEVKPGDKAYNQAHYEALGKVIDEVVYELLEKECNLKRITIPDDATDDEPRGFYFESENAIDQENLLIIIHGSGVVRAGQWARRLIINDCLETGTQIPYIKKASELGMGVVVLNTNQNEATDNTGRERLIRKSDSPLAHTSYVWDRIVRLFKAKNVAIVAHSAGGWNTVQLFSLKDLQQLKRIFAVCFTDSVHIISRGSHDKMEMNHLRKIARNWICSSEPLDTPVSRSSGDILSFSAGTQTHEYSSHCAIESIFKYIREKLNERLSENVVETQTEKSTVPDREENLTSAAENVRDQVSEKSVPRVIINGDFEKSNEVVNLKTEISAEKPDEAYLNGKIDNVQHETDSESKPIDESKFEPTGHADDCNKINPDGVIVENGGNCRQKVDGTIIQ